MLALRAMIDESEAALRPTLFGAIRESGGVQRIALHLKSDKEDMANAAALLLSRIIADPGTVDNPATLMGLSPEVMAELLAIAKQEVGPATRSRVVKQTTDATGRVQVSTLKKKIEGNEGSLSRKVELSTWISNRLRQAEFGLSDAQTALASIATPRTIIANVASPSPVRARALGVPTRAPHPDNVLGGRLVRRQGPARSAAGRDGPRRPVLGLARVTGPGRRAVDRRLRRAPQRHHLHLRQRGVATGDHSVRLLPRWLGSPAAGPPRLNWTGHRYIIRIRLGNVSAKFRAGRKRGRHNCLQIALSQELLPVAVDPKTPPIRRVFINVGSHERFAFWVRHINEHLDIPVPLDFAPDETMT